MIFRMGVKKCKSVVCSVIFILNFINVYSLSKNVAIGGLFDESAFVQKEAFKLAMEVINNKKQFLPQHQITTIAETVSNENYLNVSLAVCNLLKHGVAGIFGPSWSDSSDYVQSVCDTLEVPHIELRSDPQPSRGININMYPYKLSQVFIELIRSLKWKDFTIIYEDFIGFRRTQDIFKMYKKKEHTISLHQLIPKDDDDYRSSFQKLKRTGATHFVLDCSIDKLYTLLIQAQQVGLMFDIHHYIITTPDLHTVDLKPFRYGSTTIVGIQLVDYEEVDKRIKLWTKLRKGEPLHEEFSPDKMRVDTALLYDAVIIFSKTLRTLDIMPSNIKSLDCNKVGDYWTFGYSLINDMKMVTDRHWTYHKGLTGTIRFNQQGFRTDYYLKIQNLTKYGLKNVGSWESNQLNIAEVMTEDENNLEEIDLEETKDTQESNFTVLVVLNAPYAMYKSSQEDLIGNDRFEGFAIDIIREILNALGFSYTFKVQTDGIYGNFDNKTSQWNGMIGELVAERADLAIGDLTINSERGDVVDFTMPFLQTGISILYRKPTKAVPHLFSFLDPFSKELWIYLWIAYAGVSTLLFILGRISPKEWTNPYPCVENPKTLVNQFSFKNSFWFTVGSLMSQGSEIAPIAMSTRLLAGIWWLFVLIVLSSYTANLAAFLTVEHKVMPIRNVDDLVNQQAIEYGTVRGSAIAEFFEKSRIEKYRKIWQYMIKNDHVFTSKDDEGYHRVMNQSNYAFFMESATIEYLVERNCTLAQIGGMLDNKGYGFAMRKNSTHREALTTEILRLQESGKLVELKVKWWKDMHGDKSCQEATKQNSELNLENIGGTYVVMVMGIFMAFVLSFVELLIATFRRSVEKKISFREELATEIKFLLRCSQLVKPSRFQSKTMFEDESPHPELDNESNLLAEKY